jgi:hypothetical protein
MSLDEWQLLGGKNQQKIGGFSKLNDNQVNENGDGAHFQSAARGCALPLGAGGTGLRRCHQG